MSDNGPLPEQPPLPDGRIPRLDLRERIRLDHHVAPVTPLGAAVQKQTTEQDAKGNEAAIIFVVVVAGVVAWAINPVLILGVIVVAGVLTAVLKRLH